VEAMSLGAGRARQPQRRVSIAMWRAWPGPRSLGVARRPPTPGVGDETRAASRTDAAAGLQSAPRPRAIRRANTLRIISDV